MDARQRFRASLTFQPIDRPFRWETLGMWPETLQRWYAEGLEPSLHDPLSDDWGGMADDEFERVLVRNFNFDRIEYLRSLVVSGYTDSPFFPAFEPEVLEINQNTRIVRTREGIIQKEFTRFETSSMPQFLKFPVQTRQDFLDLLPRLDPDHPQRIRSDWNDCINAYVNRDFPIGLTLCGAFGHPRNLLGVENLCKSYYDQPGLIHEILEHWVYFYIRLSTRIYQDLPFDFILIWEDMAYKGGSLISPRLVKEFMLPYYNKVIDHIRSLGCDLIIVDSDGDISQLIPLYLSSGVNVILPFEVQAGMDIIQIRQQYGKNLAIIGGLDKRLLVKPGSALRNEIKSKTKTLFQQGGYIPSLDHTVPPDVSLLEFWNYLNVLRGSYNTG
jgi:hypothetical protein